MYAHRKLGRSPRASCLTRPDSTSVSSATAASIWRSATTNSSSVEGLLKRLHNQPGSADYRMEILNRDPRREMLPHIGPELTGGSFCLLDGHVNSLRTFRALHTGLAMFESTISLNIQCRISEISAASSVSRRPGSEAGAKIVLAAGNANQTSAPMVGLEAPMGPTRADRRNRAYGAFPAAPADHDPPDR